MLQVVIKWKIIEPDAAGSKRSEPPACNNYLSINVLYNEKYMNLCDQYLLLWLYNGENTYSNVCNFIMCSFQAPMIKII